MRRSSDRSSPGVSFNTSPPPAPADRPPGAFPELTEREREVLSLIAEYQTNAQIARRLVLSEKTVRNHVSNIFSNLQVVDRGQAISRARDAGLGRDSV